MSIRSEGEGFPRGGDSHLPKVQVGNGGDEKSVGFFWKCSWLQSGALGRHHGGTSTYSIQTCESKFLSVHLPFQVTHGFTTWCHDKSKTRQRRRCVKTATVMRQGSDTTATRLRQNCDKTVTKMGQTTRLDSSRLAHSKTYFDLQGQSSAPCARALRACVCQYGRHSADRAP